MPECWNVLECSLKHREKCGAYPYHGDQCWKIRNRECSRSHFDKKVQADDCNKCEFFCIMLERKKKLNGE